MKKDTHFTDIIFRVDTTPDFKGTVFALFPHEVTDQSGSVTSYQHVGQHSAADFIHCIGFSRPATPAEYKDLLAEMEGLGYKIKVIEKINQKKYMESYRQVRFS